VHTHSYKVGTTQLSTQINLDFSKELNLSELAALFSVLKEQMTLHAHDFDHVDEPNLYSQQAHRLQVYAEVQKQEERYMKKLMLDEVKRIAKENVDSRKPPVTSVIPTKKPLAITTTEAE
jgi:ubiquitin C-terminal hydrolase